MSSVAINVVGLVGSLRRHSLSGALMRAAQELAPDGLTIEVVDLSALPMYNEDLRADGFPPEVAAFRQRLAAADAFVLSSPEYNRSVSAVLKNAIDWGSRSPGQCFDGKPITVMTSSPGGLGGALANYHLRQIFVYLNGQVLNGPEIMVGDAKAKFDADGRLSDEPTREFIAGHLRRFAEFIAALR